MTRQIKDQNQKGDDTVVKATIVPQINGLVQRVPINTLQQQIIKKTYDLAVILPKKVQTSTLDLLVGNDYYCGLILDKKNSS